MNDPSSYSIRHSSPPHTDASGVADGPVEEQLEPSGIDDLEIDPEGVTDAGVMTDPAGGLLETGGAGILVIEVVM